MSVTTLPTVDPFADLEDDDEDDDEDDTFASEALDDDDEDRVYPFKDLPESAKDTARDWYREINCNSEQITYLIDGYTKAIGIRYNDRDLEYDIGNGSGDFVAFKGYLDPERFLGDRPANDDDENDDGFDPEFDPSVATARATLRRIPAPARDVLQITFENPGHHGSWWRPVAYVELSAFNEDALSDRERAVYRNIDTLVDEAQAALDIMIVALCTWLTKQAQDEVEYLNSDENVDQALIDGGFTFDENGRNRPRLAATRATHDDD